MDSKTINVGLSKFMHAIYMEAPTTDDLAVAAGMLSMALDLLHC